MKAHTFAFLGAGNMATAIIGAMENIDSSVKIALFDKDKSKYDNFSGDNFIKTQTAAQAVSCADYVFLSVKPQNFEELLTEIKDSNTPLDDKVFVTIAAAISTAWIAEKLGGKVQIIRAMPNTPLLYGFGVTALCKGEGVSDDAFETIWQIFGSCGSVFELPEDKMNAVIAATSSAPAYVFLFIKSICDAAKAQGMESDDMIKYIADMVIGSAEMIKRSPLSPDELIKIVTSKGGTTERAMNVLNDRDMPGMIAEAMQKCTDRAEELGR